MSGASPDIFFSIVLVFRFFLLLPQSAPEIVVVAHLFLKCSVIPLYGKFCAAATTYNNKHKPLTQ